MSGLLKIRKIITGPLMTNTIILSSEGECVVIDAGGEQGKIIEDMEMNKLHPKAIIATHGHFDHVLGVGQLQEKYGIPLLIHQKDIDMMNQSPSHLEMFGIREKFHPPSIVETLKGNRKLRIGNHDVEIVETPGHTQGSLSVIGNGFILTGDTLFKLSVGRTDIGGNQEQLVSSIKYLISFPESTKIYPGHGETSDLRFEILNNVYCRNVMERNSLT